MALDVEGIVSGGNRWRLKEIGVMATRYVELRCKWRVVCVSLTTHVQPVVKHQKNDAEDAKAIVIAAQGIVKANAPL